MEIKADKVSPEIVAVITAAVQSMVHGGVKALSIKESVKWTDSGRRQIL